MRGPHSGEYLDSNGIKHNVIDRVTGGFREINTDHAAIHRGEGFGFNLYLASLAAAATKLYRFKGPTSLFAHIKDIRVNLEGAPVKIELIKEIAITQAGTEIADDIFNLNDNSSKQPQSKIFDGTIAYTGGKTWASVIVHGDTAGASPVTRTYASGSFVQNPYLEYISKSDDTNYIIKLTNLSADDAALFIEVGMFFYEEVSGLSINLT